MFCNYNKGSLKLNLSFLFGFNKFQILVDGKEESTKAIPTLVYLSREKRPQHHHNFKAGAMNALVIVSCFTRYSVSLYVT